MPHRPPEVGRGRRLDVLPFRQLALRPRRSFMQSHLQDLCEVQRFAVRALLDLLPATETIGNNQRVARRRPHRRQQHPLADAHRDLVVLAIEAERPCHAATTGVERLELEADLLQHRLLGLELHDRLVMAVPLDDGLPFQLRQLDVLALQKFAEREEPPRDVRVLGEEIRQFIAEDRDAARLEPDDRDVPRLAQDIDRFAQELLRAVEHPPVVQRTPAAELLARDRDLVTARGQELRGGMGGVGGEMIVEGIRPEKHFVARGAVGISARASIE